MIKNVHYVYHMDINNIKYIHQQIKILYQYIIFYYQKAILSNISFFTAPDGDGVKLLLYSVILTREIKNLNYDKDELVKEGTLIGEHNYANQELVNLLLTGKGVSNIFNGSKDFDGVKLKGIDHVSEIGFLTLFEHYKYVEAGTNYKDPEYPIWVVCSESHYSVLFNLDNKYNISREGQSFDLYYYDQLMKADEEYKLTVTIVNDLTKCEKGECEKNCRCLTPPLDFVIRTKWQYGRVSWNSSDPIL